MSESETALAEIAVDRRWLWVVRLTDLVSILLTAVLFFFLLSDDFPWLVALIMVTPVLISYLKVLLKLRETPQKRSDVVLGLTWGWIMFGFSALIVMPLMMELQFGVWVVAFSLMAAMQFALAFGATAVYRQLPREQGDRGILIRSVLESCVYLGIFLFLAITTPSLITSGTAINEASAISSIRKIVNSQITHSENSGNGNYSSDLAVLLEHDLIDSVLVSGTKDGYTFTTAAVNDGTAFTANATPLRHSETGNRSFFADETGYIRYTAEDRPATAEDPPL